MSTCPCPLLREAGTSPQSCGKPWPQAALEKLITDLNCSPELFPSLAPPGFPLSSAKQLNCVQVHSLQHERNKADLSHKDTGGLVCAMFLSMNGQKHLPEQLLGKISAETSLVPCKPH